MPEEKTPKNAQNVEGCSLLLCKPIMHTPLLWTRLPGCGQLLWTTLWTMWKTRGFQQLFSLEFIPSPLFAACINPCINPVFPPPRAYYGNRFQGRKIKEIRSKCSNLSAAAALPETHFGLGCDKICVISTIPISPYDFPPPGNTTFILFNQEDAQCRER